MKTVPRMLATFFTPSAEQERKAMKRPKLHKIAIVLAAIAVGSAGISADALARGVAVFFITGRPEPLRAATERQLRTLREYDRKGMSPARLAEIQSCRPVRNRWWYGWGIRWIGRRKWLFNVAGLDAVELAMKDGTIYRIGTDEPQKLSELIQDKLKRAIEKL